MKKLCFVLALCAMFLLVGCGNGSKDSADTGDTDTSDTADTTDTDTADTADTDTAVADTGDSAADTGDHGDSSADTGDSSTDTGDSSTDTGDPGPVTGDTRTVNCENLPANASWNTASSITQTWDGSDWIPTNSAIFSETPSTSKCFFKCAENYEWNNSTCVAGTREANCTGLPSNADWNTVSTISQTWNGSTWEPSTTSSFNETGSTSQCRYKCATNYEWNGSSCVASIPECSSTSSTPCKDSSTGYIWSARASSAMTWQNAVDYCNSLTEGGLSGWHLPTITELRTLILNCPSTMPTGSCDVNDSGCLSSSCWTESACCSCSYDSTGGHSKFGETGGFWSSSLRSGSSSSAWGVDFYYGYVDLYSIDFNDDVRCVR